MSDGLIARRGGDWQVGHGGRTVRQPVVSNPTEISTWVIVASRFRFLLLLHGSGEVHPLQGHKL